MKYENVLIGDSLMPKILKVIMGKIIINILFYEDVK